MIVRQCRSTVKTESRSSGRWCPLPSVLGTFGALRAAELPQIAVLVVEETLCGLSPFPRRSPGPVSAPTCARTMGELREARSAAGRSRAKDLALGEKPREYGGLGPHQGRFAPFGAARRKRTPSAFPDPGLPSP
jgi:hypothetical protein